MIDERFMREVLHRRAESISPVPNDPLTAVHRARTRIARNTLIGTILAIGALLLTVSGFHALQVRNTTLPVDHTVAPVVTPVVTPVTGPGATDVSVVDVATGEQTPAPATLRTLGSAHEFAISPDEHLAAFVAFAPGTEDMAMYLVDLIQTGSEPKRIGDDVRMPSGGGVGTTIGGWSPDSTRLVVADGQGKTIWIVDAESGRATKVFETSQDVRNVLAPVFGPDGETVLFTATHGAGDGERTALWTAPTTGGSPTVLIDYAAFGTYSPDGSKIAYRHTYPGSPIGVAELRVANADGTGVRVLTDDGTAMSPFPFSAAQTAWSPDGAFLLVTPPGYGWPNTTVFTIVDVSSGRELRVGSGQSATWWGPDSVLVTSFGCEDYRRC
jgi:hypothetical protein